MKKKLIVFCAVLTFIGVAVAGSMLSNGTHYAIPDGGQEFSFEVDHPDLTWGGLEYTWVDPPGVYRWTSNDTPPQTATITFTGTTSGTYTHSTSGSGTWR